MALLALVAPLVDVLHGTNVFFVHLGDGVGSAQHYGLEALLRRSALGVLAEFFDALPTFFLWPTRSRVISLGKIFPSSLCERARGNPEAMAALKATLAKKFPVRVLLPVLCAAVTAPPSPGDNGRPALALLARTMGGLSRADLSPHVYGSMSVLFTLYNLGDGTVGSADAALLATTMKLSEMQLRKMYAHFCKWRGDLKMEEMVGRSVRRYAFGKASRVLLETLRGIILSCLSTVIGDVVKKLDFAASQLCQYFKLTGKDGSKRRRTSMQFKGNLEENIRPLQPMFWCLETALKA